MRHIDIQFESGVAIEVAFASIIEGMEQQIFGEYFPKVGPIVGKYGGIPLGSLAIEEAHSDIGQPKMGALFQWNDVTGHQDLHKDADFIKLVPIRDEAMDFFSGGHFFKMEKNQAITFDEGASYALVAEQIAGSWKPDANQAPLISMTPFSSDKDQDFAPSHLHICRWDNAPINTGTSTATPDVFKFKLNFPAQS